MSDHDLISRAAQTLAELRGALPDDLAPDPDEGVDGRWSVVGHHGMNVGVRINDGGSAYLAVAECADDYGAHEARALAAHIARTSSPDVVGEMITLLRMLSNAVWHEEVNHEQVLTPALREQVLRLAAAIERTDDPDQSREV